MTEAIGGCEYRIIATFSIILCIISCQTTSGQSCASIGKLGECVPIEQCLPLSSLAQRTGALNSSSIRTLQRLTCGFDGHHPKVCCPPKTLSGRTKSPVDNSNKTLRLDLIPSLSQCGSVAVDVSNRIIGGNIPTLGTNPWLVRIGYLNPRQKSVEYFCGGTIINKNYILTAAHCVAAAGSIHNVPRIVRLGEHDDKINPEYSLDLQLLSYVQDIQIQKVIPHPNYDSTKRLNDIALVRLAEDISFESPFIQPVCLPLFREYKMKTSPNLEAKENGSTNPIVGDVAGWGKTMNGNRGTHILNFVQIPILTNSECQRIYSGKTVISSKQVCAGGEANRDSCDGDSGGPLIVFEGSVDKYFQAAIVSFGPTVCGTGGLPGIYTRVSEYLEWILKSIE